MTQAVNVFEARNRALLDAIHEEEHEVCDYTLYIAGTNEEYRAIPLKCSRAQARAIKMAVFAAGGDALAVLT